jgi:ABC-type branched-subunit amino acid transport system permease subunit
VGPVIGAFFMNALFVVTDIYLVQVHPIVAGMLIILVMRFMPKGLIGLFEKKD